MLAYGLTWLSLLSRWHWWKIDIRNLPNLSRACRQLKRHSTMRSWPNLFAIGSGNVVWIRQSNWAWIDLIWDIWHALPIGRRSLSRVIWDIEHALPIRKRSLTRDEVTLPPIGKRSLVCDEVTLSPVEKRSSSYLYWKRTHQSIERWVELQGFLKYQLTVASPLWHSILCLASWFVLLKLRARMPTMQRHGVKLSVVKMLGLLPQEIESNMTILQMGR